MAFRDYITCGECETKIIYDGYDNGRDRLEKIWGDPNANSWTVHLLCPDCIKKMRADIAAARARVAELEADRRNLLDDDLKAAVCVQLQRELNDAKADLAAARALLGEVREWIPYYRWIPDLRERVDAIIGKKTP